MGSGSGLVGEMHLIVLLFAPRISALVELVVPVLLSYCLLFARVSKQTWVACRQARRGKMDTLTAAQTEKYAPFSLLMTIQFAQSDVKYPIKASNQ